MAKLIKRKISLMRWNKNLHLYIGILCSIIILLLSLTGLVINNKMWFMNSQKITYQNQDLQSSSSTNHHFTGQSTSKKTTLTMPEAIEKAASTGKFSIEHVKSVSLMNHGFGPSYYIQLNDSNHSYVVVNTEGIISKIYYNPITQTASDWHSGIIAGQRFRNTINFGTMGMIFLTGTGLYLSIRTLRGQAKSRKIKRKQKTVKQIEA